MRKDGFDIDLEDIDDQFSGENESLPPQHKLIGAKFSTFDKVEQKKIQLVYINLTFISIEFKFGMYDEPDY